MAEDQLLFCGEQDVAVLTHNMRENGVGSVVAICANRHEGVLDVQRWPADTPVPDIGLKLRCSACGGRDIDTRPNWSEQGERRMW